MQSSPKQFFSICLLPQAWLNFKKNSKPLDSLHWTHSGKLMANRVPSARHGGERSQNCLITCLSCWRSVLGPPTRHKVPQHPPSTPSSCSFQTSFAPTGGSSQTSKTGCVPSADILWPLTPTWGFSKSTTRPTNPIHSLSAHSAHPTALRRCRGSAWGTSWRGAGTPRQDDRG